MCPKTSYGVGAPTERGYHYLETTRGSGGSPDASASAGGGAAAGAEQAAAAAAAAAGAQPPAEWRINTLASDAATALDSGVQLADGDGTVPLLSLGALCEGGWRTQRLNPGGARVVVREYPHRPAYSLTDPRCALWWLSASALGLASAFGPVFLAAGLACFRCWPRAFCSLSPRLKNRHFPPARLPLCTKPTTQHQQRRRRPRQRRPRRVDARRGPRQRRGAGRPLAHCLRGSRRRRRRRRYWRQRRRQQGRQGARQGWRGEGRRAGG